MLITDFIRGTDLYELGYIFEDKLYLNDIYLFNFSFLSLYFMTDSSVMLTRSSEQNKICSKAKVPHQTTFCRAAYCQPPALHEGMHTQFEPTGVLVLEEAIKNEQLCEVWCCCLFFVCLFGQTVVEPARKAEEVSERDGLIWTGEDVASLTFLYAHVQDRINREVVNVTTLPIPAELGGLLQTAAGNHTHTSRESRAALELLLSPSAKLIEHICWWRGLFINLTIIRRCEYVVLFCVCVLQEVKSCILTVWRLSRLQQFKWTLSWFCPWISTTISWLTTSRPCLGYNHTVALVYISLRTPTYVDLLKLNNPWHLLISPWPQAVFYLLFFYIFAPRRIFFFFL